MTTNDPVQNPSKLFWITKNQGQGEIQGHSPVCAGRNSVGVPPVSVETGSDVSSHVVPASLDVHEDASSNPLPASVTS